MSKNNKQKINNEFPPIIIREMDAKRIKNWVSKFLAAVERAHKKAAKSKLHFD